MSDGKGLRSVYREEARLAQCRVLRDLLKIDNHDKIRPSARRDLRVYSGPKMGRLVPVGV